MSKPPLWFFVVVAIALLWNVLGLFAVVGDLRLSPADIAALPAEQQALHQARPGWSVVASLVAVLGGTLGCVGLLLRKRWSIVFLVASLVGLVLQDAGMFLVAGAAKVMGPVPVVVQFVVLLIAIGLLLLGRRASARSWIA